MNEQEIFELVEDTCKRIVPEGGVFEGYVQVVFYLSAEGETDYILTFDHERPTTTTVGFLEMAKHDLLMRNDERGT